jgi:purine nucleosidase
MRVHLDTDFGGDPDDACALATLLGWPDVEIVGITTNLEVDGRRAGRVAHYLRLADRIDIPVAAGAGASLTTGARHAPTWGDTRYWPEPVEAQPAPPGAALALLLGSIERDAPVIAIGAFTNLAQLEINRPGSLAGVSVVAMGGWIRPPAPGLPRWGPEMDWNVQCDTHAVEIVAASADLTLVTLPAAIEAHLVERDLPRLRAAGPVGALLARQSEAHAVDAGMTELARAHPGLPADLVNFHWDPVTCAVALGWSGVETTHERLVTSTDNGTLTFRESPDGRPATVVVEVDGDAFAETFLGCVESVGRGPLGHAPGGKPGS